MEVDRALGGTDYRPVCITASEFGQSSYIDFEEETGNRYTNRVLGLTGTENLAVTVGDVIDRQDEGDSHMSVFVPRKDNAAMETILRQIALVQPQRQADNQGNAG